MSKLTRSQKTELQKLQEKNISDLTEREASRLLSLLERSRLSEEEDDKDKDLDDEEDKDKDGVNEEDESEDDEEDKDKVDEETDSDNDDDDEDDKEEVDENTDGELEPVEQGNSDVDDKGTEDEEDLEGSVGDEATFADQQDNLDVGGKAGEVADDADKRPADKEGGEKEPVLQGTSHVTEEDFKMSKQLESILSSEGLTEEFRTKAKTIFITTILEQVNRKIDVLNKRFKTQFAKAVKEHRDRLAVELDEYLDYTVQQWLKENKLAVETGIKADITESFIKDLRQLFEKHSIDVPDKDVNIIGELKQENRKLSKKLDEATRQILETRKLNQENSKAKIIASVAEGMADTEVEKLTKLAESVSFNNDKDYQTKVKIIRENFFPTGKKSGTNDDSHRESADENLDGAHQLDEEMGAYVKAIEKATYKGIRGKK